MIKNILKKALYRVLLTITLLPIVTAHANQIQQCSSYVKQRAVFTKVFLRGFWNFGLNKNSGITIEKKLAKLYEKSLLPEAKISSQAHAFAKSIRNNANISINPNEFLWGASTSAYQNEGGNDIGSAAARYYKRMGFAIAGDSIDFYHRFREDIAQLKNELHINALRISIAWNRVEQEVGIFSHEGIEFYRNVIRELLSSGIKPIVVFHHYDIPTWFEDLGGFEKAENGALFQRFCLYVYKELAQELGQCLISMCNAPEGPAFKGYFTGEGTPGEKDNLHKTHTVIANMYYELVDAAIAIRSLYDTLKESNPDLQMPLIGTQINVLPFDPHSSMLENWKTRLASTIGCEVATYIQSGGTYSFLVTGHYRMFTPEAEFMKQAKGVNVYRYHPEASTAFDWIGVNIYSNKFLKGFKPVDSKDLIETDDERYTDNANYRNYPEGIYRAVQMISESLAEPLGKIKNKDGKPLPIIITENGIATRDHAKRTRYFKRAICTINELINDGYNVIGYIPWTAFDNYEWPTKENPEGFNSKCYGFFEVNFDKNSPDYLKRTLKEGSQYYADFIKEYFRHTLVIA